MVNKQLLNCPKCNKTKTCNTIGQFFSEIKTIDKKWYLVLICKTCKSIITEPTNIKGGGIMYHCAQRVMRAFKNKNGIVLTCDKCGKKIYGGD